MKTKRKPLSPLAKSVLVSVVKKESIEETLAVAGGSWSRLNSTLGHLESRGLVTLPGVRKVNPTVWGIRVSGVQK